MPTASPHETVIALVAFGVVALICRWVFSPTKSPVRRAERPDPHYGLLVAVTTAPSADDAVMLRDHLVAEGVRASVNADHEVLVFAADLEKARALVG